MMALKTMTWSAHSAALLVFAALLVGGGLCRPSDEPVDDYSGPPPSEHEFPRDVSTKPVNYRGPGHWATPAPDSGIQLGFVPQRLYAQVRHTDTVRHLPRSAALAEASTAEEVAAAPRLREVVSHKKVAEVYSEEGYLDSAYDHAGYDKKGEEEEDYERHEGAPRRKGKQKARPRGRYHDHDQDEEASEQVAQQSRHPARTTMLHKANMMVSVEDSSHGQAPRTMMAGYSHTITHPLHYQTEGAVKHEQPVLPAPSQIAPSTQYFNGNPVPNQVAVPIPPVIYPSIPVNQNVPAVPPAVIVPWQLLAAGNSVASLPAVVPWTDVIAPPAVVIPQQVVTEASVTSTTAEAINRRVDTDGDSKQVDNSTEDQIPKESAPGSSQSDTVSQQSEGAGEEHQVDFAAGAQWEPVKSRKSVPKSVAKDSNGGGTTLLERLPVRQSQPAARAREPNNRASASTAKESVAQKATTRLVSIKPRVEAVSEKTHKADPRPKISDFSNSQILADDKFSDEMTASDFSKFIAQEIRGGAGKLRTSTEPSKPRYPRNHATEYRDNPPVPLSDKKSTESSSTPTVSPFLNSTNSEETQATEVPLQPYSWRIFKPTMTSITIVHQSKNQHRVPPLLDGTNPESTRAVETVAAPSAWNFPTAITNEDTEGFSEPGFHHSFISSPNWKSEPVTVLASQIAESRMDVDVTDEDVDAQQDNKAEEVQKVEVRKQYEPVTWPNLDHADEIIIFIKSKSKTSNNTINSTVGYEDLNQNDTESNPNISANVNGNETLPQNNTDYSNSESENQLPERNRWRKAERENEDDSLETLDTEGSSHGLWTPSVFSKHPSLPRENTQEIFIAQEPDAAETIATNNSANNNGTEMNHSRNRVLGRLLGKKPSGGMRISARYSAANMTTTTTTTTVPTTTEQDDSTEMNSTPLPVREQGLRRTLLVIPLNERRRPQYEAVTQASERKDRFVGKEGSTERSVEADQEEIETVSPVKEMLTVKETSNFGDYLSSWGFWGPIKRLFAESMPKVKYEPPSDGIALPASIARTQQESQTASTPLKVDSKESSPDTIKAQSREITASTLKYVQANTSAIGAGNSEDNQFVNKENASQQATLIAQLTSAQYNQHNKNFTASINTNNNNNTFSSEKVVSGRIAPAAIDNTTTPTFESNSTGTRYVSGKEGKYHKVISRRPSSRTVSNSEPIAAESVVQFTFLREPSDYERGESSRADENEDRPETNYGENSDSDYLEGRLIGQEERKHELQDRMDYEQEVSKQDEESTTMPSNDESVTASKGDENGSTDGENTESRESENPREKRRYLESEDEEKRLEEEEKILDAEKDREVLENEKEWQQALREVDRPRYKAPFNTIKYPFYYAPRNTLSAYSPLRYALNPRAVPKKTPGGMEFYESREALVECPEVSPNLKNVVPKRARPGEWNSDPRPKNLPRLRGLGDKIDCLKVRYWGSEPLDSPFFKEGDIGKQEEASSSHVEKISSDDTIGFYKEIMGNIRAIQSLGNAGFSLRGGDNSYSPSVAWHKFENKVTPSNHRTQDQRSNQKQTKHISQTEKPFKPSPQELPSVDAVTNGPWYELPAQEVASTAVPLSVSSANFGPVTFLPSAAQVTPTEQREILGLEPPSLTPTLTPLQAQLSLEQFLAQVPSRARSEQVIGLRPPPLPSSLRFVAPPLPNKNSGRIIQRGLLTNSAVAINEDNMASDSSPVAEEEPMLAAGSETNLAILNVDGETVTGEQTSLSPEWTDQQSSSSQLLEESRKVVYHEELTEKPEDDEVELQVTDRQPMNTRRKVSKAHRTTMETSKKVYKHYDDGTESLPPATRPNRKQRWRDRMRYREDDPTASDPSAVSSKTNRQKGRRNHYRDQASKDDRPSRERNRASNGGADDISAQRSQRGRPPTRKSTAWSYDPRRGEPRYSDENADIYRSRISGETRRKDNMPPEKDSESTTQKLNKNEPEAKTEESALLSDSDGGTIEPPLATFHVAYSMGSKGRAGSNSRSGNKIASAGDAVTGGRSPHRNNRIKDESVEANILAAGKALEGLDDIDQYVNRSTDSGSNVEKFKDLGLWLSPSQINNVISSFINKHKDIIDEPVTPTKVLDQVTHVTTERTTSPHRLKLGLKSAERNLLEPTRSRLESTTEVATEYVKPLRLINLRGHRVIPELITSTTVTPDQPTTIKRRQRPRYKQPSPPLRRSDDYVTTEAYGSNSSEPTRVFSTNGRTSRGRNHQTLDQRPGSEESSEYPPASDRSQRKKNYSSRRSQRPKESSTATSETVTESQLGKTEYQRTRLVNERNRGRPTASSPERNLKPPRSRNTAATTYTVSSTTEPVTATVEPNRRIKAVQHRRVTKEEIFTRTYIPDDHLADELVEQSERDSVIEPYRTHREVNDEEDIYEPYESMHHDSDYVVYPDNQVRKDYNYDEDYYEDYDEDYPSLENEETVTKSGYTGRRSGTSDKKLKSEDAKKSDIGEDTETVTMTPEPESQQNGGEITTTGKQARYDERRNSGFRHRNSWKEEYPSIEESTTSSSVARNGNRKVGKGIENDSQTTSKNFPLTEKSESSTRKANRSSPGRRRFSAQNIANRRMSEEESSTGAGDTDSEETEYSTEPTKAPQRQLYSPTVPSTRHTISSKPEKLSSDEGAITYSVDPETGVGIWLPEGAERMMRRRTKVAGMSPRGRLERKGNPDGKIPNSELINRNKTTKANDENPKTNSRRSDDSKTDDPEKEGTELIDRKSNHRQRTGESVKGTRRPVGSKDVPDRETSKPDGSRLYNAFAETLHGTAAENDQGEEVLASEGNEEEDDVLSEHQVYLLSRILSALPPRQRAGIVRGMAESLRSEDTPKGVIKDPAKRRYYYVEEEPRTARRTSPRKEVA